MSIFGKSTAEIDTRRDVKRQVVDHIIALALAFPRAALGGMSLMRYYGADRPAQPVEAYEVGDVIGPFCRWWQGLSSDQKSVLRTAKGCTARPRGVPPYGDNASRTFSEHLKFGLETPHEVGCFGGWLRTAVLWAHQVREQNPHTFPEASTYNILQQLERREQRRRTAEGLA